ncbi:MAG: hypothetical protein IJ014_02980 [Rikenellaceae bacterium]|nr:hypothetical protein [Rikenellaceae bacterium]
MKRLFAFALLVTLTLGASSCRKDGTRCRCIYKSHTAGRTEFVVEEEQVLNVAKNCAGYENWLRQENSDEFRCYND